MLEIKTKMKMYSVLGLKNAQNANASISERTSRDDSKGK